MSEEDSTKTEASLPEASAQKPGIDVPMAMFMRGGGAVRSVSEERLIQSFEADAERRRDEAAAERKLSRVPVEHGGAKLYEHKLTSAPEVQPAHVHLVCVNRRKEKTGIEQLGDITVLTSYGSEADSRAANEAQELQLTIVCPKCVASGIPQGQAQLAIRQSNRSWHLDQREAGSLIAWKSNGRVEMYRSAGRIMSSEPFTCPRCNWRAKIDDNMIMDA